MTSHIGLVVWIGQKGGCIIVDSTRKGKRFPDSMSKTIPIWACVMNRAISNHKNRMRGSVSVVEGVIYYIIRVLYYYYIL